MAGSNSSVVCHERRASELLRGSATREADLVRLVGLQNDCTHGYDYEPGRSNGDTKIVYQMDPWSAHGWMHRSTAKFLFQRGDRSRRGQV